MIQVKMIDGFEGYYLVDTLGNVISMPKYQGRYFHNKYQILTPKVTNCGYLAVALSKDGTTKEYLVHRLVAKAFLPNPEDLPEVNHINGVKTDNRLENLEWCTRSYNQIHAIKNNISGIRDITLSKLDKINYYKAYYKVVLEKDGETKEFASAKEAGEFLHTYKDNVTRAIKKQGRVKGWLAFGLKRANGGG